MALVIPVNAFAMLVVAAGQMVLADDQRHAMPAAGLCDSTVRKVGIARVRLTAQGGHAGHSGSRQLHGVRNRDQDEMSAGLVARALRPPNQVVAGRVRAVCQGTGNTEPREQAPCVEVRALPFPRLEMFVDDRPLAAYRVEPHERRAILPHLRGEVVLEVVLEICEPDHQPSAQPRTQLLHQEDGLHHAVAWRTERLDAQLRIQFRKASVRVDAVSERKGVSDHHDVALIERAAPRPAFPVRHDSKHIVLIRQVMAVQVGPRLPSECSIELDELRPCDEGRLEPPPDRPHRRHEEQEKDSHQENGRQHDHTWNDGNGRDEASSG